MKQTDPQFKLRLTPQLKDKLEDAAQKSGMTMTGEILARLQASFEAPAGSSADFALRVEQQVNETRLDALRSQLMTLRMHIGLLTMRVERARAARKPAAELEQELADARAEMDALQVRQDALLQKDAELLQRHADLGRPRDRQVDAVVEATLGEEIRAAERQEMERISKLRELKPTEEEARAAAAKDAARVRRAFARPARAPEPPQARRKR